jgi:hypothetical protein
MHPITTLKAIMHGAEHIAQAKTGFKSNDNVRVIVNRMENVIQFFNNGKFVGLVRGRLPSGGNVNAVVAVTNHKDEVRMLDAAKVDVQTHEAELTEVKRLFVANRVKQHGARFPAGLCARG